MDDMDQVPQNVIFEQKTRFELMQVSASEKRYGKEMIDKYTQVLSTIEAQDVTVDALAPQQTSVSTA